MKIIETLWFTGIFGCIGIVVGEDSITKKKKAYIGVCSGTDAEEDSRFIAARGSPITIAHAGSKRSSVKGL